MELSTYEHIMNSNQDQLRAPHQITELIPTNDSRYRSLIRQLDSMTRMLQQNPGHDLEGQLSFLLSEVRTHVVVENNYMELVEYPEASQHRLHHFFICASINDLYLRANAEREVLANDLRSVRLLILRHIHVQDRAFVKYLAPQVGARDEFFKKP
jgi:hemerythrin-like metal-binding protein